MAKRNSQIAVVWPEPMSPTRTNTLTVDLPPDPGDHVAAVIEAWTGRGLTIADRRSRMSFVAGDDPDVIPYYAAVCGLVGRWVEAQVRGVPLDLGRTYDEGRGLTDAGRPAVIPTWAQVGGDDPGHLPHVPFDPETRLSPEDVSLIRHAYRLRMVPPGRVKPALLCFALVSGIRHLGRERLPFLSTGREPEPLRKDSPGQGVDLHRIRSGAGTHRRLRQRHAYEVVEPVADLTTYEKLARANATPIETVLSRLGCSAADDDPTRWSCPRPGRHSFKDARPSLEIRRNQARCGFCGDRVRLTPTQLVADTLRITPDEAASFIVDLKCVTGRPALGYRQPNLAAPPRRGTLVTAYVSASKPDRFDCVFHDAGVGYSRKAVIWRPDTANLPEGVVPVRLRPGDVVTALTVEFQPATAGGPGRWLLSITASELAERAMASQVQEIIDGRAVVTAVERVMGARAKVVVAPTKPHLDAVGACVGVENTHIDAAQRLLNRPARTERMEIIAYSSDLRTYLANALHPAEIVDMRVNDDNAVVAVTPQQFRNAVGEGGLNAQLAGWLTNRYVEVVVAGTDLDAALAALEERRRPKDLPET